MSWRLPQLRTKHDKDLKEFQGGKRSINQFIDGFDDITWRFDICQPGILSTYGLYYKSFTIVEPFL